MSKINDLMDKCLVCDYCRITLKVADLGFSRKHPERALPVTIPNLLGRDRIKEIRCSKGLITDHIGLEKTWQSTAAIAVAANRTSECVGFRGEEDDD